MSKVIKILSGEGETLGYWPRQELINKSMDMEDGSGHVLDGAPNYGDKDIQAHLALAMLGVDDGVDDESSLVGQSGDLRSHSNAYLEKYLQGRCSRSTSFDS